MSCTCQRCGIEYTADVIVSDAVWEQIKPVTAGDSGGLLCGMCIMAAIENISGYRCFHLIEEEPIRKLFGGIIDGVGLTVPRQIVGYTIDELFHGI